MSNPSLKEQLKALSFELSSAVEKAQPNQKKLKKQPNNAGESALKSRPAWLEQVQYGVEMLKAYFPACFKELKEIQPLKIGIKHDLVKCLSTREDITIADKACMVSSLAYYVNSPHYHKIVVEGMMRIDLTGQPAGAVTAAEAQYSVERRQAKLKKKSMQKSQAVTEEVSK